MVKGGAQPGVPTPTSLPGLGETTLSQVLHFAPSGAEVIPPQTAVTVPPTATGFKALQTGV